MNRKPLVRRTEVVAEHGGAVAPVAIPQNLCDGASLQTAGGSDGRSDGTGRSGNSAEFQHRSHPASDALWGSREMGWDGGEEEVRGVTAPCRRELDVLLKEGRDIQTPV